MTCVAEGALLPDSRDDFGRRLYTHARDRSVVQPPASLEHVATLLQPHPPRFRRKSGRSKGAHDGDRPDDGVVERVELPAGIQYSS
jgi:hypothetical protein